MRQGLKFVLLPCLLLLCVTVPHLEQGDFRRDTGRYAAVGLYMWSGGQLLAPQLGPDTPYFNKPPFALLVHGAFLKVFGTNLVAARVPSILAALGAVVLSVLTVRKIGSRAEAVVSGIVLALTIEFFRRTREISLDFWQLLFVMLAVFLFMTGLKENSRSKIVLSGVGIGLALLCKPFVALGLLPVFAFWAVMARRSNLLVALVGAAFVAAAVALPWHFYMWSKFGDAFTRQYIFKEVVGRAQGEQGKGPVYYYVVALLTSYWPWLLGLGWALYQRFSGSAIPRRAGRDLILLGSVWVIWVLVMISLFPDKAPNYALPLYPMLSWMVAAGLCRLPWPKLGAWYRSGLKGLAPAAGALLVILSVAPIRFQEGPNKDWQAFWGWMKTQSTLPSDVAAAGLKPNERCYFYVKTGVWMPDLDAGKPLGTRRWILTMKAGTNAPAPNAVFVSKSLQVVSAADWLQSHGKVSGN